MTFFDLFKRALFSISAPHATATTHTAMIIPKIIQTVEEKFVMLKNSGKIRQAETSSTSDVDAVTSLSFVKGMHSHSKFKKPEKVKTSVTRVSNSEAERMSKVVEPVITTAETAAKIIAARGSDFLRTCGMKLPCMSSVFGWKVSKKEENT